MNQSVDILNLVGIIAEFPQNGTAGCKQGRAEAILAGEFAPLLEKNLNPPVDRSFDFIDNPGIAKGVAEETEFLNNTGSEILKVRDDEAAAIMPFESGMVVGGDGLLTNIYLENKDYAVGQPGRPDENMPPSGRGPQDKIIVDCTNQTRAALRPPNPAGHDAISKLPGLSKPLTKFFGDKSELPSINLPDRTSRLQADSFLRGISMTGGKGVDDTILHRTDSLLNYIQTHVSEENPKGAVLSTGSMIPGDNQAMQSGELHVLSNHTGDIDRAGDLKTMKPAAEYFDENVLRDLNVRQIKIEQETNQKTVNDESRKPLFINEVNGPRLSLKSELSSGERLVDGKPLLSAAQYNNFENSGMTGGHASQNNDTDEPEFENVQNIAGRNKPDNANTADNKSHANAASRDLSGIFKSLDTDAANTIGKTGSVTVIETVRTTTDARTDSIASTRFVLPAGLEHKNANIKKTIYIKMIPEHLGTIRLTLSSLNDIVTGRMVVDNSQAMHALESNMDTLLTDLADKGVKIDTFQIALAGGQTGQNSSRGRLASEPKRNDGWSGNRDVDTGKDMPVQGLTAGRGQYIGAAGVNLLV